MGIMQEKSTESYDLAHLRAMLYTAQPGLEEPFSFLLAQGDIDVPHVEVSEQERALWRAGFNDAYNWQQRVQPIHDIKGHERAPEYLRKAAETIFDAYCDYAKLVDQTDKEYDAFNIGDASRGFIHRFLEEQKALAADEDLPEHTRQEAQSMYNNMQQEQIRRGFLQDGMPRFVTEHVSCNAFEWLTEDQEGPMLGDAQAISVLSRAIAPLFELHLVKSVHPERRSGDVRLVNSLVRGPVDSLQHLIDKTRAPKDEGREV